MSAGPARSRLPLGRLFLMAFITGFSGAMMPGPLLAAVIGQTAAQGFRAVIGLMTGHALLEIVFIALLVAGLQAVIARPRVRGVIGLLGGAALVWMSSDMLLHTHAITLDLDGSADAAYSWPKMMFWGAAICLANPLFTGWWATVGAGQLAHMAPRTLPEYLAFYLGHQSADYTWYGLVGAVIVTGATWLTDDIYRALIYGCAVIIGIMGLWFLYAGARFAAGSGAANDEVVSAIDTDGDE